MFSDSERTEHYYPASQRGRVSGLAATVLRRLLSRLEIGRIVVVTPSGAAVEHVGSEPGPDATLVLHRWRAILKLVSGGDVGFADAYIAGDWSSPDLTSLIQFAAANAPSMERTVAGLPPVRLWNRMGHLLKVNSRSGSRRNIAFHYDLGNDFYRLWLDAGMSYSSAIYGQEKQTLEDAQQAKIARVLDLLALEGHEHVLEIGCGWGGLAAAIAGTGAHVTGLTLSQEQLAHAEIKAQDEGFSDRADFRLQDYRDETGRYDRIVSIEMLEAVGEAYWPTYFETLRASLNPGGHVVLQVITIAEDRFETYRRSTDFIQRYIFPGGMLPTRTIVGEQAKRVGLELVSTECFGESYARTLADWRERFVLARHDMEVLGFDQRFRRLWEYYLHYCEAGFRAGAIDVGLFVLRG